jgi:anti-anti-sigma regulatory factor
VLIELSEIGMNEIESFYKSIKNDIYQYKNDIYILDFSKVEILSLCAIQLLICLKKHCNESNIRLSCININSNNIIQSLKTYNLQDTLGANE